MLIRIARRNETFDATQVFEDLPLARLCQMIQRRVMRPGKQHPASCADQSKVVLDIEMDVLFFLRMRTKFIRAFYEDACFPFSERKRKIEAGEDPFEPPYSEDDVPPFLDEWMEADESIDVLGQMCISMLSSSLELYLRESVNKLLARYSNESLTKAGIGRPERKKARKQGWINAYREYFRDQLAIDWTKAESNLSLLEEIVLTRNRAQHPENVTSLHIEQSYRDATKYPRSFFADELEMKLFGGDQAQDERVHPWRLNVSKARLLAAVDEVERFCSWLDGVLRKWPGARMRVTSR